MMQGKSLKIIWGVVAVGIYLLVVGLLLLYFNYRHTSEKKHYVKKDEHRIQVALAAPKQKVIPKKRPVKKKPDTKPKTKPKPKKVKKAPEKETKKKVIKEKVVKKKVKKSDRNITSQNAQKEETADTGDGKTDQKQTEKAAL